MTELEHRILDLSYKHRLSHIGSCLTAVRIIDDIYSKRRDNDPFILSCGHAGLALYVVLEKYFGLDAEQTYLKHGVHPNCDEYIHCSTGSLGQGLPIALGMAMADRNKNVYCLISDGEATEGSVYETLNVKWKYDISNLTVLMNHNGYSAYDRMIVDSFPDVKIIDTSNHWFMQRYGQEAHYKVLNEDEYAQIIRQ